ncbi:hypothetical protein GO988_04740 [Hymenobacter sp. HMF4947]|uniref:STAS/SEC14 domain-containing protein n=1 Tax=Hymenobacter ginkgonis TaxID=2682976 RepID=A0A7K1TB49_9BACT|nr:hypothetical protein [Hymenobacter ginkgonis]MVN75627.1 hypothetical protein [Hymenobacter ginkgonis]
MFSTTYSTAFLQVAYRPDLNQLTGRWLDSVTETELHTGYDALRQAALHYRCGCWLIDSRRRTSRSRSGPAWVTDHFLPQVQRELRSPLCVCFLVLPDYLQSLPPSASASRPNAAVEFARFLDEGAANAWLARRQVSV